MPHGPDAVHQLIEDSGLSYPISVTRLERKRSLENITLNEKGESIMLVELLSEVDADSFESREALESMLGPVFEEKTEERRPGVVERLKNLF